MPFRVGWTCLEVRWPKVKLVRQFDDFLTDVVNINQDRLDQLDQHVKAIFNALSRDDGLEPLIRGQIPQGSWAHRTIIKPLRGEEFDADVLLILNRQRAWRATPSRYLDVTYSALANTSAYRSKTVLKSRCVRVRYANDCHVDIVPFIKGDWFHNASIVNRAEDTFEHCDPERFTSWLHQKDSRAHGNLRKTIRLLKYVRDRGSAFEVPSVILTSLVGRQVNMGWDLVGRFDSVSNTFRTLLASLDSYLQLHSSVPAIRDPAGTGTRFDHRWSQREYGDLRDWIHEYSAIARAAYRDQRRDRSLAAWQEIFGDDFGHG
jgi:hypothetical protein